LRLKILKKLRTASLNSEFTGSYKKSVLFLKLFFLIEVGLFFVNITLFDGLRNGRLTVLV